MKKDCIFCGKICKLQKDVRNPGRWEPAYLCRTSDRSNIGRETYLKTLLDVCDKRGDAWSEEVRLRLSDQRATSDLHAADGRYHEKCRKKFTGPRNIDSAVPVEGKEEEHVEQAFIDIIADLLSDKTKTWTSVELQKKYKERGGSLLNRKKLIEKVREELKDDILVFWSKGQTSLIVFKSHANVTMRVKPVKEDEEECMSDEDLLELIAKKIRNEINNIKKGKETYHSRIDINSAKEDISPSFSQLLAKIDPDKLNSESLPATLVGNIVTSQVAKRFTQLTLSLAVMVGKKKKVKRLSQFGAVSSYDELVRFRASAAFRASRGNDQTNIQPLRHHSTGLVQAVADNFDCNISSMNGQKQTHSMALMMLQSGEGDADDTHDGEIPRLKKVKMKDVKYEDVPIVEYQGPKKPNMQAKCSLQNVQSLKELAMAATAANIAKEVDFDFLKTLQMYRTPQNTQDTIKSVFVTAGFVLNQKPRACTHH